MTMKNIRRIIAPGAWLAAILLTAVACSDGLDIQQSYSFDIETMPVQKRIAEGGTAEIRCTMLREGDFSGARYTIRYFQSDGTGELRLDDGTLLSPNDRYPLEKTEFRLYYTSRCSGQQTIDVYFEDNFGQVVQKTFSWLGRQDSYYESLNDKEMEVR
jgi:hypothetical protein